MQRAIRPPSAPARLTTEQGLTDCAFVAFTHRAAPASEPLAPSLAALRASRPARHPRAAQCSTRPYLDCDRRPQWPAPVATAEPEPPGAVPRAARYDRGRASGLQGAHPSSGDRLHFLPSRFPTQLEQKPTGDKMEGGSPNLVGISCKIARQKVERLGLPKPFEDSRILLLAVPGDFALRQSGDDLGRFLTCNDVVHGLPRPHPSGGPSYFRTDTTMLAVLEGNKRRAARWCSSTAPRIDCLSPSERARASGQTGGWNQLFSDLPCDHAVASRVDFEGRATSSTPNVSPASCSESPLGNSRIYPASHRTIFPMVGLTTAAQRAHMVRSAPPPQATFGTDPPYCLRDDVTENPGRPVPMRWCSPRPSRRARRAQKAVILRAKPRDQISTPALHSALESAELQR